ncbi:hypothetical protein [Lacipirellula limnantheis]|uniref:Uncharacterized protein n=1 Tax=Lacipirellula limnantheis TaxID=2528024 RepID=A0A517U363_9BACT|nr:hypothetical protein [Lacipirellula limnantheis]QDT75066.1 hypothetical protein I41_42750 [Lacipirellula limnantheis]
MNRSTSPSLFGLPSFAWKLILAAAILAVMLLTRANAAHADSCTATPLRTPPAPPACPPAQDSWIFLPSRFTHDPTTGARVAQYAMKPPIEPFDDPRRVTSGYSRNRTIIRGGDGSVDTIYRVTSFGNGRGGMDAEWERFHDAWRGSTIAGGQSQAFIPGYGAWYGGGYRNSGGFGGAGYGGGGYAPGGGGYGPGSGGYGPGGGGYGPGAGVPPWGYGGYGYGPGYGVPDAGRLDPDGADGYREPQYRTPNREFYYDEPARDFDNGGHHGGGGGHHHD